MLLVLVYLDNILALQYIFCTFYTREHQNSWSCTSVLWLFIWISDRKIFLYNLCNPAITNIIVRILSYFWLHLCEKLAVNYLELLIPSLSSFQEIIFLVKECWLWRWWIKTWMKNILQYFKVLSYKLLWVKDNIASWKNISLPKNIRVKWFVWLIVL